MKCYVFFFLSLFLFPSISLFAQQVTDSVQVHGNCGMCKKRIEKAALLEGVKSAVWDKNTQMVTIIYDANKTNTSIIQQKIASVGHDTDKFTAPDEVYNKLPACCLYERKGKPGSGKSKPH